MIFPESIQALLLTGGQIKRLPPDEPEVPGKGYVTIGDMPMAARTLRALTEAKRISKITMVTPLHPQPPQGVWEAVSATAPAKDSLFSSLFSGFEAIGEIEEPVLLVAGDLPFLSPQAVDDFVERCSQHPEASVWYGFLSQADSQAKYPNLHHTWLKIDGTKHCGTGLIGMRPSVSQKIRQAIDTLTRGRKNPFVLCKALGYVTLVRALFGILKVEQAEQAMTRLLGVKAVGIKTPFAETAFNVDDGESLQLAREIAKGL